MDWLAKLTVRVVRWPREIRFSLGERDLGVLFPWGITLKAGPWTAGAVQTGRMFSFERGAQCSA